MANLSEKYNIIPIYISREGVWLTGKKLNLVSSYTNFTRSGLLECYLVPHSNSLFIKGRFGTKQKKIDAIVLALHGAYGEDGSIQGLLELTQIPYVGSSVFGSSITMDKVAAKMLMLQNNIKTPKFVYFYGEEFQKDEIGILKKIESELGSKVVVKPCRAGSSIGVSFCQTQKEIVDAINLALCFDNKVIVEEAITNFREVNVAVLGAGNETKISSLEEVVVQQNILSFDQKYINAEKNERIVDVHLDEIVEETLKEYAKKAFYLFELAGVCRMDFFVQEENVFLNEINAIPGSMANYLFKDFSFSEMLDSLLEIANKQKIKKDSLTYLYSSTALLNYENMCGKMHK